MNTRESRKPLVQMFLVISRMSWVSDFRIERMDQGTRQCWFWLASIDGKKCGGTSNFTLPGQAHYSLVTLLSRARWSLLDLKP